MVQDNSELIHPYPPEGRNPDGGKFKNPHISSEYTSGYGPKVIIGPDMFRGGVVRPIISPDPGAKRKDH